VTPGSAVTPLAGCKVLVTGATGFIGSHLALRLSAQGVCVRALARSAARGAWLTRPGLEIVEGDLGDAEALRRAARGCLVVFHIAAWVGRPNTWEAARRINLDGTRAVVEAAIDGGARRVVHTSSIAAYGPQADGVITEDWPLRAVDPYGHTKALSESIVLNNAGRIEVSVLRPAQVFGPRGGAWTTGLFSAAKRGWPILVGGGHGTFHPCYIENLIDAYLLSATRAEAVGQAFNVVDGVTTWRGFVGHYARMAGRVPRAIPVAPARLAVAAYEILSRLARRPPNATRASLKFLLGRCRFSNDSARTRLGWTPRISIEEGMRRTEAWLRQTGRL